MARPDRPDFVIVGAPKAGTTALHSALALHPEVFTTTPKEPKYWLCGDAPPPHWIGPGDAHSQQEWVWRRRDYEACSGPPAEHQVRGESTPFYLWSYPAHRRIAEHLPDVKLVAVVRDPIDRAYSNWMHLWSDGLERVADFEVAFARQRAADRRRVGAVLAVPGPRALRRPARAPLPVRRPRAGARRPLQGHRRGAGRDRRRGVPLPRHRREPPLGDPARQLAHYAEPGWRTEVVGPVVRAGAWLGQFAPPAGVARRLGPAHRPAQPRRGAPAEAGARRAGPAAPHFAEDIALLGELTGEDFSLWLSEESRGSFQQRVGSRASRGPPRTARPPVRPRPAGRHRSSNRSGPASSTAARRARWRPRAAPSSRTSQPTTCVVAVAGKAELDTVPAARTIHPVGVLEEALQTSNANPSARG